MLVLGCDTAECSQAMLQQRPGSARGRRSARGGCGECAVVGLAICTFLGGGVLGGLLVFGGSRDEQATGSILRIGYSTLTVCSANVTFQDTSWGGMATNVQVRVPHSICEVEPSEQSSHIRLCYAHGRPSNAAFADWAHNRLPSGWPACALFSHGWRQQLLWVLGALASACVLATGWSVRLLTLTRRGLTDEGSLALSSKYALIPGREAEE